VKVVSHSPEAAGASAAGASAAAAAAAAASAAASSSAGRMPAAMTSPPPPFAATQPAGAWRRRSAPSGAVDFSSLFLMAESPGVPWTSGVIDLPDGSAVLAAPLSPVMPLSPEGTDESAVSMAISMVAWSPEPTDIVALAFEADGVALSPELLGKDTSSHLDVETSIPSTTIAGTRLSTVSYTSVRESGMSFGMSKDSLAMTWPSTEPTETGHDHAPPHAQLVLEGPAAAPPPRNWGDLIEVPVETDGPEGPEEVMTLSPEATDESVVSMALSMVAWSREASEGPTGTSTRPPPRPLSRTPPTTQGCW